MPSQKGTWQFDLRARALRAQSGWEAGPIAQRSEQATHNRLVAGSNPAGPTPLKQIAKPESEAWSLLRGFKSPRATMLPQICGTGKGDR